MSITADGQIVDVCPQPTGITSIGCGLSGYAHTTLVIQYNDCTIETFPNDARCYPKLTNKGCGLLGKPKTSYVEVYEGGNIQESPMDPVCSVVATGMKCEGSDLKYTCGGKTNTQTNSPVCVGRFSSGSCNGPDFIINSTSGAQIRLPNFTDCVDTKIIDSGCGLIKGGAIASNMDFVTVRANGLVTVEIGSVKCRPTIKFQGCGAAGLTPSPNNTSGPPAGIAGGGLANSDGTLSGDSSIWDQIGTGNPSNNSGVPSSPGSSSGGSGSKAAANIPEGTDPKIADRLSKTPVSTYYIVHSDDTESFWAFDKRCAQSRVCGNSSSLTSTGDKSSPPTNLPPTSLVVTWNDSSWSVFSSSWRCLGGGSESSSTSEQQPNVPQSLSNDPSPSPAPMPQQPLQPSSASSASSASSGTGGASLSFAGGGSLYGVGGDSGSSDGGQAKTPSPPNDRKKACAQFISDLTKKLAAEAVVKKKSNLNALSALQVNGWIISNEVPYAVCIGESPGSNCDDGVFTWERGNEVTLVNDLISGGTTSSVSMTFLNTTTELGPACDDGKGRRPKSLLLNQDFSEGEPPNSVVGKFTVVDPSPSPSFVIALVDGIGSYDNSLFTIAGDMLICTETADWIAKPAYAIRASVTDSNSGLAIERQFTVNVKEVHKPPTDIKLSNNLVANASVSGTIAGKLTLINRDNKEGLFTLTNGSSYFTVNSNNELITNFLADHTSLQAYSISLKGCDGPGAANSADPKAPLCFSKDFTIFIGP